MLNPRTGGDDGLSPSVGQGNWPENIQAYSSELPNKFVKILQTPGDR
jgi:hypothetical protein